MQRVSRVMHGAVVAGLVAGLTAAAGHSRGGPMAFSISSPAFAANGSIPSMYTCDGRDIAPPLEWSGAPSGTKAFALIVDDPDAPDPKAPKTTWVHWVVYDIPASASGLPEGAGAGQLPNGTRVGTNDWKKAEYGGPCPPIGRHRYFFKLYALGATLGDLRSPSKADLEKAMKPHVIGTAQVIGTYEKTH